MKKILIALLSLAMLFSFAACDNSGDTPVDPDQPGDDVTTGFTGPETSAMATSLVSLVNGTALPTVVTNAGAVNGYGIAALLGDVATASTDNTTLVTDATMADEGYTLAVDPDTFEMVITKQVGTGLEGEYESSYVTLTVGVVDNTSSGTANTTKNVMLETFEYAYDIQTTDKDEEYAMLEGAVNGWLVGNATITLNDDGDVESVVLSGDTVSDVTVILASSNAVTASLGGVDFTASSLFNYMNNDLKADDYDGAIVAYSDYQESAKAAYETALKGYVTQLITETAGASPAVALPSEVLGDMTATTITTKEFSTANGGSATIVYTAKGATVIASAGSTGKSLSLLGTQTITVNLYGDPDETLQSNATTFTVASYSISGTFQVADTAAADSPIKSIVVTGITGDAVGTVEGANNVVSTVSITSLDEPEAGTVAAGDNLPVGPEIDTTGTTPKMQEKEVVVDYAD